MSNITYTPAAYWHRQWDEILEPRQTVTVETVTVEKRRQAQQQPSPNLDWRGVPFPRSQP